MTFISLLDPKKDFLISFNFTSSYFIFLYDTSAVIAD